MGLARVDSLPANVAKEIRPEIYELLNSYSDVDEDEHLMMEEIKDDLSPSADDILAKFQQEAIKKKEAEEIEMRRIEEANRVKALKEKEKRKLVDEQAAAMINNMNKEKNGMDEEEDESIEDDDEDADDEDEDEEEHNGNAPPGLVRVKLQRDDSMTKVKLFDPETMENEHDLKEEPEDKPMTPLTQAKSVKAAPFVAHMSSSEFAPHRAAEVREAVIHARSQQKNRFCDGTSGCWCRYFPRPRRCDCAPPQKKGPKTTAQHWIRRSRFQRFHSGGEARSQYADEWI